MESSFKIYTDGACRGNHIKGGERMGGWGLVVINDKDESIYEASGTANKTTNNIMELTAAVMAMRYIAVHLGQYIVRTDSMYVAKNIPRLKRWAKENYKGKANAELWRQFELLYTDHGDRAIFQWVKGHADDKWNIVADALATEKL